MSSSRIGAALSFNERHAAVCFVFQPVDGAKGIAAAE